MRRVFLVEDLADDPDAYSIPAIRRFGERAATPAHRRRLAQSIRLAMTDSSYDVAARLQSVRVELDQLVAVLEDEQRSLAPCSLVTLERWSNDPGGLFRDPPVSPWEAWAGHPRRPRRRRRAQARRAGRARGSGDAGLSTADRT